MPHDENLLPALCHPWVSLLGEKKQLKNTLITQIRELLSGRGGECSQPPALGWGCSSWTDPGWADPVQRTQDKAGAGQSRYQGPQKAEDALVTPGHVGVAGQLPEGVREGLGLGPRLEQELGLGCPREQWGSPELHGALQTQQTQKKRKV